ncbi:DEAD/DEAH box helicase [Serratia sp. JSRIV006]|uniref:DEAD/DEAH box helicase n=1 Tax=Serratia sp. JSRIV006 TaxID=2831896 RepID=UPI001CC0B858|nr:DEAD/DEAH box helicase [Serratia sp. JSRIV006]UAN64757.1 DEAD/DEAH box helicase [Serratia sp. JSRIV006]
MNETTQSKNIHLATRLADDAFESPYFKELYKHISKLYDSKLFDSHDGTSLENSEKIEHALRFADILSHSPKEEYRTCAFEIISKVSSFKNNDSYLKFIGSAVINRLGVYAAENLISRGVILPLDREIDSIIKKSIQKTDVDGVYFTDRQYELYQLLKKSSSISFAGPTSMGKSFVINAFIKEIVAEYNNKNIALIVPTRALISQNALKLKSEIKSSFYGDQYEVITTSYMISNDNNKGYIFILTPERLVSIISSSPEIKIDYLFVDEAQKLTTKNDSRSLVTYSAIEQTLNSNPDTKLFFSSPNLSNPDIFNTLFNRKKSISYRSTEGATAQNLYFIDLLIKEFFYVNTQKFKLECIKNIPDNYNNANDLIYKLNYGKSKIIYCGGIDNTLERTREFIKYLKRHKGSFKPKNAEIVAQIREFVHDNYELAEAINYGVAFHFGNLPQSIRDLIEHHFKIGNIDYLFCTSTLLEGVNLPARSVFILTHKKGLSPLESVDFWNLAGRAGRLAMELAGDIFCIRDDSKLWNKKAVDNILLSNKNDISLIPSFYIEDSKRLNELNGIINTGETANIKNAEFLRTLGDMLRIDTIREKSDKNLPLMSYFQNSGNTDIILSARNSTKNIRIPLSILLANSHIAIDSQHNAFNEIKRMTPTQLKLSWQPTYEEIVSKLNKIFSIYQIDKFSTGQNRLYSNSIPYYAVILLQWMHGNSLQEIIAGAIAYKKNKEIRIKNALVPFDSSDPSHITIVVNDTIKDIELRVGYQLQNYISHYCQLLTHVLHGNPGANWSQFIEFGSNDQTVWHLQMMGFSRDSAVYLKRNFSKYIKLNTEKNKLVISNRELIKSSVKKNRLHALEIQSLL